MCPELADEVNPGEEAVHIVEYRFFESPRETEFGLKKSEVKI